MLNSTLFFLDFSFQKTGKRQLENVPVDGATIIFTAFDLQI